MLGFHVGAVHVHDAFKINVRLFLELGHQLKNFTHGAGGLQGAGLRVADHADGAAGEEKFELESSHGGKKLIKSEQ